MLANSQACWEAYQLSQDLSTAMRSRAVIEQAKGIVTGAQRCSADEAFLILIRASATSPEELVARIEQSRPPKG